MKSIIKENNPNKKLWYILVPWENNQGKSYSILHHNKWDKFVMELTGGLTIMKVAKGYWDFAEGYTRELMVPVMIMCTLEDILKIVDFTGKHYNQKAVMYFKLTDEVCIQEFK